MIFYRTRQSWLPRKHFSLEPGKLVLCICNDQQLACYPSLPYCHLHPPTPQKTGSKKYFKSQAETWKMYCLSVWIKVCVSVSPVFLIILLKFCVLISMVSRQGSPSKSNCWKYKKTLT